MKELIISRLVSRFAILFFALLLELPFSLRVFMSAYNLSRLNMLNLHMMPVEVRLTDAQHLFRRNFDLSVKRHKAFGHIRK